MNFNFSCLKCCCCLSCYCSNKKASTKNIDKLEELIQKVLSNTSVDKSISYFDYLDRPISSDLCNWSNEVNFIYIYVIKLSLFFIHNKFIH